MKQAPFLKEIRFKNTANKNDFPVSLPAFIKCPTLQIKKPVIVFSGENGTGKSTLLEALAYNCEFNLSGGSQNNIYKNRENISIEYEDKITFSWKKKVSKGFFLRADSFYNFASYLDDQSKEFGEGVYGPYGGTSLHSRSHGEAFLSLFSNRIVRGGIYILDEPEAALSPASQLALLALIVDLVDEGNIQFVIATHSPILMSIPEIQLYNFNENGIEECVAEHTNHFRIMARFFSNPQEYIEKYLTHQDDAKN
ncbi:MAG: AAA family ATPase [Devosiaceae bacterium]|nr:AAA family ATPase [Devosiaceae bacterium]